MNRLFAGLVLAAGVLCANAASAQVVIQGEGQAGGVYGQGTVYVAPAQGQPQQLQPQPQAQPQPYGSPYVAQQQAQPQPVRTVVHTSPTMALLVPGVIALGAGWLIHGLGSLGVAQQCVSLECPEDLDTWTGLGWIPVAGPWLAYGLTDYLGDYAWFNILFGIVQGVGAVLTVLGVAIQQEWEEAIYVDLGEGVRLAFDGGGSQVGATLSW
ncbi:hypothetical protein [Sandaracinus amylolyticus]|uniref:Uncharacterized protein n=1 Tax=Sandaracinus amylolyticus TaxID=927083 RepID=A0A0F6YJ82_9BACT|nr:hypothetical protein [Sandaracinus amylolyticus]AKF06697.1 hypothetical protein DB32_003846 [Sandaracinus amylolyticus]